MTDHKANLVTILTQCHSNKSFNQFNLIITMTNYLLSNDTHVTKVELTDYNSVRVSMMNGHNILGINFNNDNTIGITLPYSGLFIVHNGSYNMQYDEIKSILLNKGI